MKTEIREYYIDGKEVTKEEYTRELVYQLYLEKKGGVSHGKLTQEELTGMALNNKDKSAFFEVGNKILTSYIVS